MKKLFKLLGIATIAIASMTSGHAALFTNTFGTKLAGPSDCDDCFTGPLSFTGLGQSINFFGTTYTGLFVGSNGYATFGAGASNFVSQPLNTETIRPMIAGNIQRQPFYGKYVKQNFDLPETDFVHDCGFYSGNYPELTEYDLETISSCLYKY